MVQIDREGKMPNEGVVRNGFNVIFDYSRKATETIKEAYSNLKELYKIKRAISYGEVGACNE